MYCKGAVKEAVLLQVLFVSDLILGEQYSHLFLIE